MLIQEIRQRSKTMECLISIFAIGVACSTESPGQNISPQQCCRSVGRRITLVIDSFGKHVQIQIAIPMFTLCLFLFNSIIFNDVQPNSHSLFFLDLSYRYVNISIGKHYKLVVVVIMKTTKNYTVFSLIFISRYVI